MILSVGASRVRGRGESEGFRDSFFPLPSVFLLSLSHQARVALKHQDQTSTTIDECTRCVISRILSPSRLMKAMSGVLES